MNKAKGNMYGFVTHTWNPITGKCIHACRYCYMNRWDLTEIHLNNKVLNQNHGKDNFIFIGSGTDMFANNVNLNWIHQVLWKCDANNKYLFQTKNPSNLIKHLPFMPLFSSICVTLESNYNYPGMGLAPRIENRYANIKLIREAGYDIMITIEPIMDFDHDDFVNMLRDIAPFQINIGADSGNNNLNEPSAEKVKELIKSLEKFTKVHIKDNLNRLLKD